MRDYNAPVPTNKREIAHSLRLYLPGKPSFGSQIEIARR
jgi:hypothetical protein